MSDEPIDCMPRQDLFELGEGKTHWLKGPESAKAPRPQFTIDPVRLEADLVRSENRVPATLYENLGCPDLFSDTMNPVVGSGVYSHGGARVGHVERWQLDIPAGQREPTSHVDIRFTATNTVIRFSSQYNPSVTAVRSQAMTPGDLQRQAEVTARQIMMMTDPEERRNRLQALNFSNPSLCALVRDQVDNVVRGNMNPLGEVR